MKRPNKRARFNKMPNRPSGSSGDNSPVVLRAKSKPQNTRDESDNTSYSSLQPDIRDNLYYEIRDVGERNVNQVKPENSSDTDNSQESSSRPAGSISSNAYDGSDECSDSSQHQPQNTDISDDEPEHTPFREHSINFSPIILSPDVKIAPDPYNGSDEDSESSQHPPRHPDITDGLHDTKQMEDREYVHVNQVYFPADADTDSSQECASLVLPDKSRSPGPNHESGDNPDLFQHAPSNIDFRDEPQDSRQMEDREYVHVNQVILSSDSDSDTSHQNAFVEVPDISRSPRPNNESGDDPYSFQPTPPNSDFIDEHQDTRQIEDSEYVHDNQDTKSSPTYTSPEQIMPHGYYDSVHDADSFQHPPPTPEANYEISDREDPYANAEQVPIVSSTVQLSYYEPIDDFEAYEDPPRTPDVHYEATDIQDFNSNSRY